MQVYYLDSNLFISFFQMFEVVRYEKAREIFKDLRDCKFMLASSPFLERELKKKETELKIPLFTMLNNLKTIGKVVEINRKEKIKNIAKQLVSKCELLHWEDALHLAVCKSQNIPFVSFDDDALLCATELGVRSISAYRFYL